MTLYLTLRIFVMAHKKRMNQDDDETTSTNDITPMDIKKRHHGVRLHFFRSAIYTMFTVDH